MNEQKKSAVYVQKKWILHRGEPKVLLIGEYLDDPQYLLYADGRCFLWEYSKIPRLLDHNPFKWTALQLKIYAHIHRRTRLFAVTWMFILAVEVLYWTTIALSENGAEILGYTIGAVGGIITIIFMLVASATFAIAFFTEAGRAFVFREKDEEPTRSLMANNEFDLGEDMLIYQYENETDTEFHARAEEGILNASIETFVLVIPFRYPSAAFYFSPRKCEAFERGRPRFQGDDWPDDEKVSKPGFNFINETYPEYMSYINKFLPYFRVWAPVYRLKLDPTNAPQTFMNALRVRATAALIGILFSVACFGQEVYSTKSAAVKSYLGTRLAQKPEEKVTYIFEGDRFTREGNGKSNFVELLSKGFPFYSDRNKHGRLLSIYLGSELIERRDAEEPQPETVLINSVPDQKARPGAVDEKKETAPVPGGDGSVRYVDPVRPRSFYQEGENTGPSVTRWISTDSATNARNVDNAILWVDEVKHEMWMAVKPGWRLAMYIFTNLLLLPLLGFGGYVRYVAKSAANETAISLYGMPIFGKAIYNAQQGSSALLLILNWVFVGVIMLDAFMHLVYWNLPLWLLVPIWFLVIWAAEKFTKWCVPNPTMVVAAPSGNQQRGMQKVNF